MNIPFTKMQGTGNDFIILNCLSEEVFPSDDIQSWSKLAIQMCRRKVVIYLI